MIVNWDLVSQVMSIVVIPLLALWIQRSTARNNKANHRFYKIILQGFKANGNLTLATAIALESNGAATESVTEAKRNYLNFCNELDDFIHQQASTSI